MEFKILILALISSCSCNAVDATDNKITLPLKSDFNYYLQTLKLITDCVIKNRNFTSDGITFGMFIMKVNLKIIYMRKKNDIIDHLIEKSDDVINAAIEKAKQNPDLKDHRFARILFNDDEDWLGRLQKYSPFIRKGAGPKIIRSDPEMEESMAISDKCLHLISTKNLRNRASRTKKCRHIEVPCHDYIKNGSDVSYRISHRLLLLLAARFSRGCHVFSPVEDKELTRKFCSIMYIEVSNLNYENIDLMMEDTALCALAGETAFLNRKWLRYYLLHQLPSGCFQGGPHVTGVAAAAYSSALRYIAETYY